MGGWIAGRSGGLPARQHGGELCMRSDEQQQRKGGESVRRECTEPNTADCTHSRHSPASGGCLNGGGQLRPAPGETAAQLIERVEAAYHE